MSKRIRALGLISGGLDSTLAARLLIEQGIEIRGVYFSTGFCITDPSRPGRQGRQYTSNLCNEALKVGDDLKFAVEVVDVSQEYLDIVTNPRWGYGKNANPCVDCRIMMLEKAKQLMPKLGADFVFTGEVIGQRPMTQHRPTLRQMEKQSGLEGFLLRPLSAKNLPETEVERRGWVDRSTLKGFSGRSRKPQIALAEEFGLTDYPQPAGGCCYLTDPSYGRKFFDFLDHKEPERQVQPEDFILMKVGRHLRLTNELKVIVGRDESENAFLEDFRKGRWALTAQGVEGPLALLDGRVEEESLEKAARVVARYCDGRDRPSVNIECDRNGTFTVKTVKPMSAEESSQYILT
jgi:tRNA U34 2-thiouridine synthase MnmA/TrmU